MNKYIYFIIVLSFCLDTEISAIAADTLSLTEVIDITLDHSYSIKIAANDAAIASANATRAATGMLPVVSATIGQIGGLNDINQSLLSGQEINRLGAGNKQSSANIALNWTLFDGFGMFANYDRLLALKNMGELKLRSSIENTISKVIMSYCTMVRNQAMIQSSLFREELSKERLRLSVLRFSVGRSGEQDTLQASIDFQSDKTATLRIVEQYKASRLQLNNFMGGYHDTVYTVTSHFPSIHYDSTKLNEHTVIQSNIDLQAIKAGIISADAALEQVKARSYPRLSLNTAYSYNQSNNDGSFVISNQTKGASFNITAQYDVLDGFLFSQKKEIASLQLENVGIQYKELEQLLLTSFRIAKGSFDTYTAIDKLEENNVLIAKKNSEIAFEKLKQGTMSSYDFRVTQQSIYEAQFRSIQAKYERMLSLSELMKITSNFNSLLEKRTP
ncbi:membrane protein [Chlorobiota bacterium]|nr:membrane protein [Chlorobiota bacterium]